MIDYATRIFSYDSDGQFIFPLTVWITDRRTQNFTGMNFCQKQVTGIHFDLPEIETKTFPSQPAIAAFTKTNLILIYHKF